MSGTIVNVPGAGQVSFPEGMSDADIETAIKTKILPQLHAETPDAATGTMAAAAHGLTFGFGDELKAAIHAAAPGLIDVMNADNPFSGNIPQVASHAPTFGERYDEELAKTRQSAKNFEEAHPVLSAGGNIAGNIATGGVLAPAAGPSVLGNAAKYAAYGGALGAAQGFGEGEGGFANRAGNAAVGGTLGAAGGAAIPIAGAIGSRILESAPGRAVSENVVSPIVGKLADALEYMAPKTTPKSLSAAAPEGGQVPADSLMLNLSDALRGVADKTGDVGKAAAINNLASAMQRAKMSPDEALETMRQLGDPAVLADLGKQFQSVAIGAKVLPGETRDLAQNVLTERAKGYGPKLTEAFTGGEDVPSLHALGESQQQNISDVGNQAFDTMRAAGLNTSPEMQGLIESPRIQKLIPQIEGEIAQNGGTPNDVDVMHKIKEALQQKVNSVVTPESPYMDKGGISKLANAFTGAFHEANPAAEMADRAYQHANSLPELTELGRRFMQKGTTPGAVDASAESVADKLANATPFQSGAYTQGVQNAGRVAAEENPVGLARNLTPEKTGIVAKLTQALGPEGAQRVLNQAGTTRTFEETRNALLRGSQTAEKLGDAEAVGNTRFNITPEGIRERATEKLKDVVMKLERPNEHVLNETGKLILNPNAAENAKVIEALRKVLGARAKGGKLPVGAAAATANTLGNP
jgi:hypothetical protein